MAYTTDSVRRFLEKNSFLPESILYILRGDNMTRIFLPEGRQISCRIPIGLFEDCLPPAEFIRINKDVLVSRRHVVNVTGFRYLMSDGAVLEGRHHGTKCHRNFLQQLLQDKAVIQEPDSLLGLQNQFPVLDRLPLPFCIIQTVTDFHGNGITFIFRYCNPALSQYTGIPMRNLLNRSFYDVFKDADEKWKEIYANLSLEGGHLLFRGFCPEAGGKLLTALCYRIAPSFCACLFLDENVIKLENPEAE